MKTRQKVAAAVLVLLLCGTVYELLRTEPPAPTLTTNGKGNHASMAQALLVDKSPLKKAQRLGQIPNSHEELPFAQEALRLGDKEMDLAFAAAVRDATEHPPALSAEAKEVQARLQKAERALETDKVQAEQLTTAEGKASGEKKDALDDQLDLAKAQLELDQDEVDDAKQDLIRAGGDPQGRIQRMVEEHEAASHTADSLKVAVSAPIEERGLIHRLEQWSALHQKQLELWRAKQEAESAAASFSAKHEALATEIDAVKKESTEPGAQASAGTVPSSPGKLAIRSHQESSALLKATKRLSAEQKKLASFDKRIDDQKQLADVYGKWINVIAAKQRSVMHSVLAGLAIVFGILLIGVFFDNWLERLLGKTSLDRRQVETLRAVTP